LAPGQAVIAEVDQRACSLRWYASGAEGTGRMSGVSVLARVWRRSSACLPGDCVEVAASTAGYVLIRDSADKATSHVLILSCEQWHAFTRHIKRQGVQSGKRDASLMQVRLWRVQANGRMIYPVMIAGRSNWGVAA